MYCHALKQRELIIISAQKVFVKMSGKSIGVGIGVGFYHNVIWEAMQVVNERCTMIPLIIFS